MLAYLTRMLGHCIAPGLVATLNQREIARGRPKSAFDRGHVVKLSGVVPEQTKVAGPWLDRKDFCTGVAACEVDRCKPDIGTGIDDYTRFERLELYWGVVAVLHKDLVEAPDVR